MAAPAAITYGVSKLSTPQNQAAQPAPQATELRTYPEYVTAMERINMEREKAGLQRRPIMTQEEWVCAQKAGSTAAPAPIATPAPTSTPAPAAAPAPATTAAAPASATASTTSAAPAASPAPASGTPPAETTEKASEAK